MGNVPKDIAEEALEKVPHFADTLNDTVKGAAEGTEAVTNLQAATKGLASSTDAVDDLGNAFKGLGVQIGSAFKALAMNPMTYLVGAAIGTGFLINNYIKAFDKAKEKSLQAQGEYSSTTEEISSLNSELETTKTMISELSGKKNLTLTEKSELNKLQTQNKELERQIDLKSKLSKKQGQEAVDEAMSALDLKRTEDLTKETAYLDKAENIKTSTGYSDILTATENEIEKLATLQKEREKLLSDYDEETNKKEKDNINKDIETTEKEIQKYDDALTKNLENIQELKTSFESEPGVMKSWLSSKERGQYKRIEKIIDDYINNDPFLKQQEKLDKIFENDSFANAQQRIMDALRNGQDLSVKDITNQFPELVAECNKAGISVESLREHLMALASTDTGMSKIESDFADFQSSAISMINSVDALNGVLASNVSGKGLGISLGESGELTGEIATIQEVFSNLDGYDPSVLFEKTANGVHLNVKAFRTLQAEQEALEKKKYAEKQLELQQKINDAIKEQEKAKQDFGIDSQEYTSAGLVVDELQNQLETVNQLSAAYDGATSAYQKWLNAQSNGEEGDMYRNVSETMRERGAELYKEGRYNTNEFRAIAQYYSNEDLTNASMEQVVAAYEKASSKIKRYFTGDKTGIDNFVADMKKLSDKENLGWVEEINENGISKLKFNTGSDEEIAKRLGLSKEAIQAIYRAMGEYTDEIVLGDNISTEQLNAKLAEATANAEKAKETLSKLQESGELKTDIELNVDVSQLDEAGIDERIASLKELQKETETKFGVDSSELELVNQLLAEAELRKQQLAQETSASVSVEINGESDVTALGEKLASLPKGETANVSVTISNAEQLDSTVAQLENVPHDTEANFTFNVSNEEEANTIQAKIDQLNKNREIPITAKFSFADNTGNPELKDKEAKVNYTLGTQEEPKDKKAKVNYESGKDSGFNPKDKNAKVNYTKNSSSVDNYKPSNKKATVKFDKDSSIPDKYKPSNKSAKVNYTLGTTPSYNPKDLTRTLTYNIKTSGSIAPANGTAHSIGTANKINSFGRSFATGNWGLKQNEKGALINEVAPEIIVRDGKSFIVNNGFPAFTNLKRGDIIFNGAQSKALLEHGYITGSHAKLAYEGSHYLGSAFSKGSWTMGDIGNGKLNKPSNKTSKKQSTKAKSKSSSKSSAEKAAEDLIDWIAVLLERVAKQTERAIEAIDTAIGLVNKQSATSTAISKVQNEIAKQQQAYNAYLSKANSLGLSSDYVNKVQNGSLNIENVKNEDLKKKIEDYKKWLDFSHVIYLIAGKSP